MNSERAIVRLALACLLGGGCADLQRGTLLPDAAPGVDAVTPGTSVDLGGSDVAAPALSFALHVHPLLLDLCGRCHGEAGQASRTGLVLGSDAAWDLAQVAKLVNPDNPAGSRLLSKGAGIGHEGGAVLKVGTPDYRTILAWITQGSLP